MYQTWVDCFQECNVDMDFYTTRTRSDEEVFPWDFLDCGVNRAFLLREWKRAAEAVVTPNCKMQCQGCGAARFGGGICFEQRGGDAVYDGTCKICKIWSARFTGHLDVLRFFQKAIRRAGLDVVYTHGFNPHQVMSFAAPLGVGLCSVGEYMDVEIASSDGAEDFKERLQEACPYGIDILSVKMLPEKAGNAMASVAIAATYAVI